MSFTSSLIQAAVYGISLGLLYILIAIGLTLIFGLMDVVNFAHGAFVTFGAYMGMTAFNTIDNYLLAFLFCGGATALLGFLSEKTLISRFYSVDPLLQLPLTFGIALIIEGALVLFYGPGNNRISTPSFLQGDPVLIGGTILPRYRIFLSVIALVIIGTILIVLRYTKLGLMIGAGVQDRERSQLIGIRVSRVSTMVFTIGSALAGIGGFLSAPLLGVYPGLGTGLLIISFVIVILGGLGSIRGTIIAALIIGIAYNIMLQFQQSFAYSVIFLLMISILVIRPQGIYGREGAL